MGQKELYSPFMCAHRILRVHPEVPTPLVLASSVHLVLRQHGTYFQNALKDVEVIIPVFLWG